MASDAHTQQRIAKALESISTNTRALAKSVEALNTNLVQIGQNLKDDDLGHTSGWLRINKKEDTDGGTSDR